MLTTVSYEHYPWNWTHRETGSCQAIIMHTSDMGEPTIVILPFSTATNGKASNCKPRLNKHQEAGQSRHAHCKHLMHRQPCHSTHLNPATPRMLASADFRFLGVGFPMEVMGERATPGYKSRLFGSSMGDAGSGRLCPTTRRKPVMNPESN